MHEFAFDAKLAAIVRVKAETYAQAKEALSAVLAVDLSDAAMGGLSEARGITITEASITIDDTNGPQLFELDGEDIEEYGVELLEGGMSVDDFRYPNEAPTMASLAAPARAMGPLR